MTAHGRYSLLHRDILTQPIQMQLSKKQKTFSELFPKFLKHRSNFQHFEKYVDDHSLCISEITDSKRCG